MKKILGVILAVTIVMSALCGCNGVSVEESSLYGTWKTETMGYYTITTFSSDGTLHSVYKLTEGSDGSETGLSQEILDSMESELYYKVVAKDNYDENEKEFTNNKGVKRGVIRTYTSIEDMENDINYESGYFYVKGDTLTVNGSVYTKGE